MADITWRTVTMPPAYAGVPFEAGLAETGSLTGVTNCTVTTGALPPGITITADFVRLTGTPKASGPGLPKTYTFTLTMTDTAGGVVSPTFTITVYPFPDSVDNPINSQPPAAQLAKLWPSQF